MKTKEAANRGGLVHRLATLNGSLNSSLAGPQVAFLKAEALATGPKRSRVRPLAFGRQLGGIWTTQAFGSVQATLLDQHSYRRHAGIGKGVPRTVPFGCTFSVEPILEVALN